MPVTCRSRTPLPRHSGARAMSGARRRHTQWRRTTAVASKSPARRACARPSAPRHDNSQAAAAARAGVCRTTRGTIREVADGRRVCPASVGAPSSQSSRPSQRTRAPPRAIDAIRTAAKRITRSSEKPLTQVQAQYHSTSTPEARSISFKAFIARGWCRIRSSASFLTNFACSQTHGSVIE
jgi:hypothetical protein